MTNAELNEQEHDVEEKLQGSLDELFDEEAELDEPVESEAEAEDAADPEEPTPQDTDEPTEEEVGESDSEAGESGEADDSTPQGEGETDSVEMPDAYFRAAVHQGWKPEDVKEFFEADPKRALRTLENIYNSTNKLSSEFAKLGQARMKDADPQKTEEKSLDLDKYRSEYGDDDPLVKELEAMQKRLDEVGAQKPQQGTLQQQFQPQFDTAQLQKQIDTFFSSDNLGAYEDYYGLERDPGDLTQNQAKRRWEVLNTADQIMMGAQVQGKEMSVSQALESAHLLVSEPVREQAVRKDLLSKVKKRSRGLTLKPKSADSPAKKKPGEGLEAKVQERLSQLTF